MVVLTAKNLGERQRELNQKVHEATSTNVDFVQIKNVPEQNDIDKLFKIDVASKYKNVDYIMDTFKSGDPLYISRALKCIWLFDDEYSNFINVDYLHQNVFPYMSSKMKKKLLATISVHVRDEVRATSFYEYCKDTKLDNIAYKFLIFTSEDFKLKLPKTIWSDMYSAGNPDDYLKQFIKSSFKLARESVSEFIYMRGEILYKLRYLYSVSNIEYLELLEEFDKVEDFHIKRFGLRLSKHIITKYKDRVLKYTSTYFKILNKKVIARHSTIDDAKIYLASLIPEIESVFWDNNFCNEYEYVLNVIPPTDRFAFIKKTFADKYHNKPFETIRKFYDLQYYKLMTQEERNAWALNQIVSKSEILGAEQDYKWYEFVNFDKAFVAIKKLVKITPDKEKRLQFLNVLITAAKNEQDLEQLLDYFYTRHINEMKYVVENFVDSVIYKHNPFEYNENCWTAFNKILYSLDVYSITEYNRSKVEYRSIAIIHHILKKKDVPEALLLYMDSSFNFYTFTCYTDKLKEEEVECVYQYMFHFFMHKFHSIVNNETYTDEVKYQARKYIYSILDLLHKFKKSEDDCPEMVMKLIKQDWNEFNRHALIYKEIKTERLDDDTLIRYLKTNAPLVVNKIPAIKIEMETSFDFILNRFLRKLKIYYPNYLTKTFIDFFRQLLTEKDIYIRVARAAAYGIFQLANDSDKIEFLKKYTPLSAKIDHTSVTSSILYIQRAICEAACTSRPPVPLDNILMYIKGDYVKYCLPMFNSYLANLPTPLCIEFVKSILDAPLSVQKHGLRMAFGCFSIDDLILLVTSVWKKTKNVSLRMVIYQHLFHKMLEEKDQNQNKVYAVLKTFTLDLHEDDDSTLFEISKTGELPTHLLGDYIETTWLTIAKFPKKILNLQRVEQMLGCLIQNMDCIGNNIIQTIVDDHIKATFDEKEQLETDGACNKETKDLENEIMKLKWQLAAKYITSIRSDEELAQKLNITNLIIQQYFNNWNKVCDNIYGVRISCFQFIAKLESESYKRDYKCYSNINVLLQNILDMFLQKFSVEAIYLFIWERKLNMMARKIITESKTKISENTDVVSIFKEIGFRFAEEFVVLAQEFITNAIYYSTFFQDIAKILITSLTRVIDVFKEDLNCKEDNDDLHVIFSYKLVQLKTPVTNLFALRLMPLTYNNSLYLQDYNYVLTELINTDDRELRCNVLQKFVNSDSNYRALINL